MQLGCLCGGVKDRELGGRESPEMVRRYAHLSAEHLAPYADRLCALRAVANPDGTFLSHPGNSEGSAMSQPLDVSGAPGRT